MRITGLAIRGYKSLLDVSFQGCGGVNVFVGRNNAGKSAILNVLRWIPYTPNDRFRPKAQATLAGRGVVWSPARLVAELRLSEDERSHLFAKGVEAAIGRVHIDYAVKHHLFEACRVTADETSMRFEGCFGNDWYDLYVEDGHQQGQWASLDAIFQAPSGPDVVRGVMTRKSMALGRRAGVNFGADVIAQMERGTFSFSASRRSRPAMKPEELEQPATLAPDGGNLIRVLHYVQSNDEDAHGRVIALLNRVLPDVGRPKVVEGRDGTMEIHLAQGGLSIPLHDMGSGTDQVLLIATALAVSEGKIIYIEEPENYLHVGAQRRLMRVIEEYSTGTQFFVTTQSPALLEASGSKCAYRVRLNKDRRTVVDTLKADEIYAAAVDLGFSPGLFMQADAVLFVEGPNDIAPYQEWISKFSELAGVDVAVLHLGGNNMHHEDVKPAVLKRAHPKLLVTFDSEKAGTERRRAREALEKEFKAAGVAAFRLPKAALENYFPLEVLKAHYPNRIPDTFAPSDDSPLADQLPGVFSKQDNGALAARMTREQVLASDVGGVIKALIETANELRKGGE